MEKRHRRQPAAWAQGTAGTLAEALEAKDKRGSRGRCAHNGDMEPEPPLSSPPVGNPSLDEPSPDDPSLDDPSLVEAEAIAAQLGVDLQRGLPAEEAARRLEADGPNQLRGAAQVPLWRRILEQFRDPLVYLLLIAVVVSLGAWIVEGAHGVPIDAVVIAAIVVLNAVLGFVQESRAA